MTGNNARDVHWLTFAALWVILVLSTMAVAWPMGWQVPMEPVALGWALALVCFFNGRLRGVDDEPQAQAARVVVDRGEPRMVAGRSVELSTPAGPVPVLRHDRPDEAAHNAERSAWAPGRRRAG